MDEETGLYYYGARYYDPRTSVWQSADPVLGRYLPTGNPETDGNLPGMGGVFNSINLGLYSYAAQNPVIYVDPDGQLWGDVAKYTAKRTAAGWLGAAIEPTPVGETVMAVATAGVFAYGLYAVATAPEQKASDPSTSTSTASSTTTTTSATSKSKDDNQGYFVRVQVQGKDISTEIHIPIPSNKPVTAQQAVTALGALESQTSKSDKKLLGDAFQKAETWINRVAAAGGVPPIGSTSFSKRGVSPNDARVDVDVLRGPVNLVNQ